MRLPLARTSLGRVLYRERPNWEVLQLYALLVFVPPFVFLIVFKSGLGAGVLAFIALAVVGALAPRRSAVHEHGVALSVRPWSILTRGTRRLVVEPQIERAWPILRIRPLDVKRTLHGYEVVHSGGRGRVLRGPGGRQREARLEEAMTSMLGSRRADVWRPVPDLTPDLVSRIQRLVSRPRARMRPKFFAGLFVMMAAYLTAGFGEAIAESEPLPWDWLWPMLLAVFMAFLAGSALFAWAIVDVRSDHEILSAYFQVRSHEKTTGARVLPEMRLHPDFTGPDVFGDLSLLDFSYLRGELLRWRSGYCFIALMLALAFGAFAVVVKLALTPWLILIAVLSSFLLMAPAANSVMAYEVAKTRLKSIIREEWRTRTPILPPDFAVSQRWTRLRAPIMLTDRQLRRMRAAHQTRSVPFLSEAVLMLAFLAGLLPFLLDLPWPVGLSVLVGLVTSAAALAFWIYDGRVLLDDAREYEVVSGQTVLPPDLL